MPDALQLLREDHNKVKQLFKEFERAEEPAEKQRIANEALMELEIHAEIEEEIFYPKMMKQPGAEDMMLEAEEEHAVAKALIAELQGMRTVNSRYEAKFKVLSEYVLHHVQEEEEEMFPKAAELGRDFLNEAGAEMSARKMELMQSGGPKRTTRRTRTGTRRAATRGSRSTSRTTRAAGGARRTTRTTAKRTTATRGTGTRKRASTAAKPASSRGSTRSKSATTGRAKTTRSAATKSRTTTSTRAMGSATRAKGGTRAKSTGARSGSTRRTSTRKSA